jgi:hypothetical protein
MALHGTGIDWNSELKKIEREFDGLPPEPPPSVARTRKELERLERERKAEAAAQLGVLVRLTLVVALAAGMPFWPYSARCGGGLALHLSAVVVVLLAALWSATLTFRHRMPKSHALAMGTMLFALGLAGLQVLPRIGYAKADAEHPAAWRCAADGR